MCNRVMRRLTAMGCGSRRALLSGAVGGSVLGGSSAAVATGVTLPDVGVDLEGLFTAGFTQLGSIVVVAVGAWFAFMVIKKGLKWAARGMG